MLPHPATSSEDASRPQKTRPLGFWAVVALVFFSVSGGPFGIEDSVRYGGPALALTGLLVLPVVWGIPEALVTAELGTMFPEDSGFAAWVTAAFGPFWGFQEGFLSWISGVIDNSIYPLLLARYLKWFIPLLDQTLPLKIFLVLSTMTMTYLNYRGLKLVGRAAVVLTIFIMCPFVVMAFVAAPDIDPRNWTEIGDASTRNMISFANVMFWNLNYWDSVGPLGGEISDVQRILPRAMMAAVALVGVGYFLPVLTGVGVLGSEDWPEGAFSYIAKRVGGRALEGWVVLAAVASQMGLFTAELSSDSCLLLGLSEKGMLPKFLSTKSKHDTPSVALLLSCSGMIAMLISSDFESTIEMLNATYCLAELLEFAALIRLRISQPGIDRPYKIPLGVTGLCLMLAPASILAIGIIAAPFATLNFEIVFFIIGCCVGGVSLYFALEYFRSHNILKFNAFDLKDFTRSYEPIREEQNVELSGNL